MPRRLTPSQCIVAGLLITVMQIAIAVSFAKTDGSLGDRYLALVQHDSYWFANIIDRGYGTIVPPIERKEMEVSNVAFFPGYPILAGAFRRLTGLSALQSLLLIAQAAACGFWTYFFLFCQRWKLPFSLQIFGALTIALHPAAFFLVAGYSESLFLFSLAGFIYWNTSDRRGAAMLAVLHGIVMSGTRIVGLPCAIFPVARALYHGGFDSKKNFGQWLTRVRKPILVMFLSMLGGLAFFAYCQVRWGRWDIYMLTQSEGWAIEPDYLAVFKPENYHFALPPLYDGRAASQFTSALAGVIFILIGLGELGAACVGQAGLAGTVRFLFVGSHYLLHLGSRGRLRRVGKHAPLRSLCARMHRSRRAPLPARRPVRLADGAGVCDHFRWAVVRGRARIAGLLCLELHSR